MKNNCKGQSTEYSRAIPSQPSSDISAASDSGPESPSVEAFAFGKSNWDDLTKIPKAGILIMVDREVSLCSSSQKSTDWITGGVGKREGGWCYFDKFYPRSDIKIYSSWYGL